MRAWALLPLALACAAPEPGAPHGPFDRFVLVTIDTLRADHLGAFGYPRDVSPFFDARAREGVLFERAYAAMSTTVPSHATILTGLYPAQHGVLRNGLKLREDLPTLGELFAAAGFATAAFAATQSHFGPARLGRGFDRFDEPAELSEGDMYRNADAVVDRVLAWKELEKGARFFLWVHFYDAHVPLRPPEAHRRALTLATRRERDALVRWLGKEHGLPAASRARPGRLLNTMDGYDAEIRFVDAELARLFDEFARRGLSERTLWIVTADHGEGLGSHGYRLHTLHVYEEQVHVPLLFWAPGEIPPRRVAEVVEHVDLLPTLVDLAGLSVPAPAAAALPGASLVGLLRGEESVGGSGAAFAQRQTFRPPEGGRAEPTPFGEFELGDKWALVESRWKYIHRSVGGDELYDLAKDPNELENRVFAESDRAGSMRATLLARLAELRAAERPPAEPVDGQTARQLRALGYAP